MIIDLDKLNLRELFEVRHQRTSDCVQCTIRLTIAHKINMHATVRKDNVAIACKAVEYRCKPLISFNATRTLEELIEHRIDNVF